ncbi:MAG: acyl-CoA thioesterase [Proteobacteria bacterium]|nr:acyl-CoA thioesterase [Pseudomonadota bacterium]
MNRTPAPSRADFRIARTLATRWEDNDVYGHVNNVVYYSWFDTAVNAFLIERGLLDPDDGAVIGLVVESGCRYHRAISFPQNVTAMIRVGHLGSSSVRYEIGLFDDGAETAAAEGHFIHVYVDRQSRRPSPLPAQWRSVLEQLQ